MRVYLRNQVADIVLPQLQVQQKEIEQELGTTLIWNPHPENRDKVVGVYKDADLQDRKSWPEYLNWMVEMTTRFRKVVPHIRKLDLNEPMLEEPQQTL